MKCQYITLIGLLLPMAGYSKDPTVLCEYLEEASCLKAKELQKLDEQIRTTCCSLWTDYQSRCKDELYHAVEHMLKEEEIDIQLTYEHFMEYGSEVEVHLYKGYPNYYVIREEKQDTTEINANETCIKNTIHALEDAMIELCNNFIAALYTDRSLDDDLTIVMVSRFAQFKPYAIQLADEIYALQPLVISYQTGLNEFFAIIKELLPFIFYTSPDPEQAENNSAKKISSGIPLSIGLGLAAGAGLALCGITWKI